MSTITRLYLQALTTVTAATTGSGVSTASIPVVSTATSGDSYVVSPATLVIRVAALDAGATARLEIQDTVDNFSVDTTTFHVEHIVGKMGGLPYAANCAGASASAGGGPQNNSDEVIRIPWYDTPDARYGVASSKMRVNVTSLNQALAGSVAAFTYEVWIEY